MNRNSTNTTPREIKKMHRANPTATECSRNEAPKIQISATDEDARFSRYSKTSEMIV